MLGNGLEVVMWYRRPVSAEQFRELNHELVNIRSTVDNLCGELRSAFGVDSLPVYRAEEILAAVQRLEWELQREQAKPISRATGGGGNF
jgi:hypothetical protein